MAVPTAGRSKRVVRRRIGSDQQDLFRFERALTRSGFPTVVGIDEAGRGACAGPLVVGAVVLSTKANGKHPKIDELGDSKMLTALARERVYTRIVQAAAAWSVVVIEAEEVDRIGLHRANIEGMRRALARVETTPDYVLSDGFAVPGTAAPNLGIWKGDQVAACVAAAGIIAKVTRDRIMTSLHTLWPEYGFDLHKGYATASHLSALAAFGPSTVHRQSFAPVRRAANRPSAQLETGSGHDLTTGDEIVGRDSMKGQA